MAFGLEMLLAVDAGQLLNRVVVADGCDVVFHAGVDAHVHTAAVLGFGFGGECWFPVCDAGVPAAVLMFDGYFIGDSLGQFPS